MMKRLGIVALALCMAGTPILISREVSTTVLAESDIKIEGVAGEAIRITMPEQRKDIDVLRSDKEDGEYTKIGTIKKGKTTFTDAGGNTELGDKVWYYKIEDTLVSCKAGSMEGLFATDTDAINYMKSQTDKHAKEITFYYEGYTKGLDKRLLEDGQLSNQTHISITSEAIYYAKRNNQSVYMVHYMIEYDMTPEQEEELAQKQTEILKELDNLTEAEKVEKLYTYMAEHIVAGKDKTAYGALVKGSANSEGVAKAFNSLMSETGIECIMTGNDTGYFNLVRMADGLLYDVDVYREIEGINNLEYNRYDYLLTERLKEHKIDQYNERTANAKWKFSKTKPENITAMTEEGNLVITWNRVPHAQGYKVQRSDSKDGAYTDVVVYDGQPQEERGFTKNNTIIDSTAEAGKTYYYRVKACSEYRGEMDEGPYSDAQRVTYYGVLNLGINTSSIQPLLIWNPVEGASAYRVWRKEAGKEEEVIAQTSKTDFVDTSAQFYKNYSYRVQVVRDSTSGDMYEYYSNYVTTYGIKNVINAKEGGLTVEWEGKDSNEGYRLYRYDTTTSEYKLVAITAKGQNSFTDTGTEVGKSYKYRLAPYIESDRCRDINQKSIEKEGVYLDTPEVAGARINDIPVITWKRVEGANRYEVYVNGELYETCSGSQTQMILGKEKGKTVELTIRAVTLTDNKGGQSSIIKL